MQSSIRVVVSLVLLSSVIASYDGSMKLRRDGVFSSKLRRDGVLNLYPFPRVGRASRNTWQVPLNNYFLGKPIEYEPVQKRQLYAFPRVGRSDLLRDKVLVPAEDHHESGPDVRAMDVPGMWFGPRLGRSYKSDDDDFTIQNGNDNGDTEQAESIHENKQKRESNLMQIY